MSAKNVEKEQYDFDHLAEEEQKAKIEQDEEFERFRQDKLLGVDMSKFRIRPSWIKALDCANGWDRFEMLNETPPLTPIEDFKVCQVKDNRVNKRGKQLCSALDCPRRRRLILVDKKWWLCDYHANMKIEEVQYQKPRGHTPSMPLKRLPILDYEASPPGGLIISTPIAECFMQNNNFTKKSVV